jgi:hypothetical protein
LSWFPDTFSVVDGCLLVFGAYYGDWSVFSDGKDLIDSITLTRNVFKTPKKGLPLLVNHEKEWVKLFVEWRLKGGC